MLIYALAICVDNLYVCFCLLLQEYRSFKREGQPGQPPEDLVQVQQRAAPSATLNTDPI